MNPAPLEIEAKFALPSLDPLRLRLLQGEAQRARPPLREINVRFDFPDGRLRRNSQVLRLRKDGECRLTLKAPGPDPEHRQEIEFGVDDPAAAEALLTGLGLEVFFIYEKIRETFIVEGAHVMLDELPFGFFVEIEADDLDEVRRRSEPLGLAWEDRLPISYLGLFDRLQRSHRWAFRDATFANFAGISPCSVQELQAAGVAP